MNTVTMALKDYGIVTVTSAALARTIEKYLPYSTKSSMQDTFLERHPDDWELIRYWGISEFLMVFADWDCNVDSSFYSVDNNA